MKKLLSNIILTIALFMFIALNSFAAITSSIEIDEKIDQLNKIVDLNIYSFINKTDLIGERALDFEVNTTQYKKDTILAIESLKDLLNQIDLIKSSNDISSEEKNIQISRLYQEADKILYNIDSKTIQYIYMLHHSMPTITYQRFSKKFREFYNNLSLTNNKLTSK